jgi:hypothetical protein
MSTSRMNTEERYRQLLDSYGADPSKWPSDTPEDFHHWALNTENGKTHLQTAREVDQLLQQQLALQKAPSHLFGAILADASNLQEKQGGFRALIQLFSPKPLGGFIAAACLGILIGTYSPNILSQTDTTSIDDISLSNVTIDWGGESING